MSELRLKVEYVPIGSIAPDPANAKEHPDWQVEEIANSIDQFGMDDPIGVAGEPPTIIEGHGRLLACKRLGMERVPIIRLDHLDAQARKAYMLAHNQLTMNTGFDMDALQATMDELTDFDMSDFGFDAAPDVGDYGTEFELPDNDAPNQKTHTLVLTDEQDRVFMDAVDGVSRDDCDMTGGNEIGDRVAEVMRRWVARGE